MVEIVDLALNAVIGSFEIYTINSSIKNKNLEINVIISNGLFGVPQPK